jgi:uncharacterized membrane protein YvlD (DUF360 family)
LIAFIVHVLLIAALFWGLKLFAKDKILIDRPLYAIFSAAIFAVASAIIGRFCTWIIGRNTLVTVLTLGLWRVVFPFLLNALLLWITTLPKKSIKIKGLKTFIIVVIVVTLMSFVFSFI